VRSATQRLGIGVLLGAVTLLADAPARGQARDGAPPTAEAILRTAFALRYDLDTRQIVHLVVRNASGDERRRRLHVASKRIDGRLHSLGRFVEPPTLRGTTVLTIENDDRSDDHFIFLPALQRIRRVTSAQRADAFMGTDLSYEDFERRWAEDYAAEMGPAAVVEGAPVFTIRARPRFDSGYARVDFFVARSDFAILEIRYYKRGSPEPFKVLTAPRAHTEQVDGHVLPTRMVVRNHARSTETEVRIEQLAVNPDLDDSLFTSTAMEVGRPIPGLN